MDEVLDGLRHHAFIGGNDEQRDVNAARTCDHGPDERLVPGHVDHANGSKAVELQWRETQLDRDARAASPPAGGPYQRPSGRAPASSCRGRCVQPYR